MTFEGKMTTTFISKQITVIKVKDGARPIGELTTIQTFVSEPTISSFWLPIGTDEVFSKEDYPDFVDYNESLILDQCDVWWYHDDWTHFMLVHRDDPF